LKTSGLIRSFVEDNGHRTSDSYLRNGDAFF